MAVRKILHFLNHVVSILFSSHPLDLPPHTHLVEVSPKLGVYLSRILCSLIVLLYATNNSVLGASMIISLFRSSQPTSSMSPKAIQEEGRDTIKRSNEMFQVRIKMLNKLQRNLFNSLIRT